MTTNEIKPPPMQVVIKGWWIYRERSISVNTLERVDRMERSGNKMPKRPWWKGFSNRWKKI